MRSLIPFFFPILSTAKTPATGFIGAYFKSDGKFYKKTSAGVEDLVVRPTVAVQFSLPEDIQNTWQYFFSGFKQISTAAIRSGSSNGFLTGNSCNPVLLSTTKLVSATMVVKALGVQAAAPIYPVILKTELWSVGFDTEGTKIMDIDFSIPNTVPVGAWSPVTSNHAQVKAINTPLNSTYMYALKFVNGTTASQVGQLKNCLITLIFEL